MDDHWCSLTQNKEAFFPFFILLRKRGLEQARNKKVEILIPYLSQDGNWDHQIFAREDSPAVDMGSE
jgi:hypothetical protein